MPAVSSPPDSGLSRGGADDVGHQLDILAVNALLDQGGQSQEVAAQLGRLPLALEEQPANPHEARVPP